MPRKPTGKPTGRPKKQHADPSVNSNSNSQVSQVNSTDSTAAAPLTYVEELKASLALGDAAMATAIPTAKVAWAKDRVGIVGLINAERLAAEQAVNMTVKIAGLTTASAEQAKTITKLTRDAETAKAEIDRLTKTNRDLQSWKDSGLAGLREIIEPEVAFLKRQVAKLQAFKDDVIRQRRANATTEIARLEDMLIEHDAYNKRQNIGRFAIDAGAMQRGKERVQLVDLIKDQYTILNPPPEPEELEPDWGAAAPKATPTAPSESRSSFDPTIQERLATEPTLEERRAADVTPGVTPGVTPDVFAQKPEHWSDTQWATEQERVKSNPSATPYARRMAGLEPLTDVVEIETVRRREGVVEPRRSKPVIFEKRRFDQPKTRH